MRQPASTVYGGAAILCLVGTIAASAQTPAPSAADDGGPANKALIAAALKLTSAEADKYELLIGQTTKPAQRVAEPLLKWSNPAAGEIHGNVFLWTVDDRPAVIGSLFKWFSPHTHMSHEFHLLAERPVMGKYEGREVWRTAIPGVSYAKLPEAPRPAAGGPQRLLQIRRLARDFAATKKERNGVTQELRLLTQPLYRYAAPADEIADGALYGFVQGTDPEVFLLIEARGAGDSAAYWFAAARMNSVEFHLRYQDRAVWSAEIMPWANVSSHAEIYTSFMHKNVALP